MVLSVAAVITLCSLSVYYSNSQGHLLENPNGDQRNLKAVQYFADRNNLINVLSGRWWWCKTSRSYLLHLNWQTWAVLCLAASFNLRNTSFELLNYLLPLLHLIICQLNYHKTILSKHKLEFWILQKCTKWLQTFHLEGKLQIQSFKCPICMHAFAYAFI